RAYDQGGEGRRSAGLAGDEIDSGDAVRGVRVLGVGEGVEGITAVCAGRHGVLDDMRIRCAGRTKKVTQPDGSATTYPYAGDAVTITDAASIWKKQVMAAFGNVAYVIQPDPTPPGTNTRGRRHTPIYDCVN